MSDAPPDCGPPAPSRLQALTNPALLSQTDPPRIRLLLTETLAEIRACHLRTGMLAVKQARARVEAYHRSEHSSVAGRERDADAFALDVTEMILDERATIAALEVEAAIYRLWLE